MMLTSTWDSEISNAIITGVLERIGDDDIQLHIFNAYDDLMETEFFRKGREIYSLPNPDRYDGLIVALSTVDSVKYVDKITGYFHDMKKPAVGIDTHASNTLFCGLDNYRSMYQLMEHMIMIHDCRTFNYLGGPEDNDENMERYRAFCDCLEAHGIKHEKKRVLHKDFLKYGGVNAYHEWKERGIHMADAVICANDYMALGYIGEAQKDGISIPDYMKVTGFDNIAEADKYSPSITSINRNWKSLGYESMDALMEAMEGNTEFDTRFVEGRVVFNESCGCDLFRDVVADYNELLSTSKEEAQISRRQSYARQLLSETRSFDEYEKALGKCRELLNMPEIAVCVNASFLDGNPDMDKVGFDDDITVYTDKSEIKIDRKERLYPDGWRKDEKALVFSVIRNNNQTFGYAVTPYRKDFFTRVKHRTFMESLSLSADVINHRIAIKKLKESQNGK